jgi:predicted ATP-dependent endonuclease of OLD family
MNFFVGNNNCGKTTVFKAIEFILQGGNKEDFITKNVDDNVSVEIELKGEDLEKFITTNEELKKYQIFLIDSNSEKSLKIMRSSENNKIQQGGKGKEIELDIKKVRIFNPETKQFENPTGIDKTISALFDAQFVWADLKNEDYRDFGKTKIVGKIINTVTKGFQDSEVWSSFKEAHKNAFGENENSLSAELKPIQAELQKILSEQYGDTEVKFNFGLPEIDNFFKTGNILLSDNGIETDTSEKGTGMQRALALSLIQVYANVVNKSEKEVSKPIFFFIDEPETFLHPKAQDKLLEALEKISASSQIFITTHSPYLLKKFKKEKHKIKIFSKDNATIKIDSSELPNLFGNNSPTWGEINYYAFDVLSVEFHNELYGFVQEKSEKWGGIEFDKWLVSKNIATDRKWIKISNGNPESPKPITLPSYIRNFIHHPENTLNEKYTNEELKTSIEDLIAILKN